MEQCTNVNVHFSVAAAPLAHAQQKRDRELLLRRWTPFTAKQRRSGVTLRIQLCVCRLLRLSVCLFGCSFVCLCVCLFVCSFVCLFACLLHSVGVFVMFVRLCVCMVGSAFACVLVCMFGCLFVCLFVCLLLCMFVRLLCCSF